MTGFGKRIGWMAVLAGTLSGAVSLNGENLHPLAGADEKTPSRSHYFSWIDNTNEGSTERQTLANLEFFKWLHDEYGLDLDIYALDAGAIDTPGEAGDVYQHAQGMPEIQPRPDRAESPLESRRRPPL